MARMGLAGGLYATGAYKQACLEGHAGWWRSACRPAREKHLRAIIASTCVCVYYLLTVVWVAAAREEHDRLVAYSHSALSL